MKPAFIVKNLIGVILITGNLFWLYLNLELLYNYHFTNILYLFKLPDWLLVLNSVLAISGVFIGVFIIAKRLKPIKWLLIDIGIVLFGLILKVLSVAGCLCNIYFCFE